MSSESGRVVITVRGRVQGVSFRYYTREKALKLGIRGFVKNLRDLSVLIVAEGPESSLSELVQWARQGPQMALVEDLTLAKEEFRQEFKTFEIR